MGCMCIHLDYGSTFDPHRNVGHSLIPHEGQVLHSDQVMAMKIIYVLFFFSYKLLAVILRKNIARVCSTYSILNKKVKEIVFEWL